MADDDDKKAEIINLFKEGSNPRSKRAPRIKAAAAPPDFYVSAKGDAMIAGGDIHNAGRDININTKKYSRTTVHAPPGSLTSAQAKHIQDAIEKLVDMEVAGGVRGGDRSALFAKWHKMVKDRYDVPSYRVIPTGQATELIAWLKQLAAMNRSKLRRTDNPSWRNDLYKAIWARARELGLSKGDVYSLVLQRLDKQVTSLKQLGEQSLQRLYEMIMAKRT